ncbi:MAG: MsnO8 family LLM class oxidoreductase, partial [Actinomycetota bacterium]|nr:MsnO8 family LLM class oxidoreductase [Actinomycetota bacterium]
TAPEVLSAYVASRTSSIRVGAGGILLSHYSPLKVAETFRTLETLFPGRIDLGLGRTTGADPLAAEALADGPGGPDDEHYRSRVADVIDFLHDSLGPDHRFAGVRAMPDGPGAPEAWVLGSSSYGSALASGMGLPFSFAHFVSPRFGPQVMAAYRRQFRPSPLCPVPVANVGVSVLCAETDAEARRVAVSDDVWHLRLEGSDRRCLLPVEEAEALSLTDLDKELLAQQRHRRVVGAPDRVRAILLNLADAYGVEELVVRTVSHDPEARLCSYRLLAAAFELSDERRLI